MSEYSPVRQQMPRAKSSCSAATVTGMQRNLSRRAAPLPLLLSCVPPAIAAAGYSVSKLKEAELHSGPTRNIEGCVAEQAFAGFHLQGFLGVARAESRKHALPGGVNTGRRIKVHGRCNILILNTQEGLQLTRPGWIATQCCLHDRDALLVHQVASLPWKSVAQDTCAV